MLTAQYTGSSGCTQSGNEYCGARNSPLVAGNAAGFTDSSNTYLNNTLNGGLGVQMFDADVSYFSTDHNHTSTNPLFDSTAAGARGTSSATRIPGAGNNFALQSTSPLIGYGQTEPYLPASDADAGACSHTLSTCPAIDSSAF